jgi:hypothetical protein
MQLLSLVQEVVEANGNLEMCSRPHCPENCKTLRTSSTLLRRQPCQRRLVLGNNHRGRRAGSAPAYESSFRHPDQILGACKQSSQETSASDFEGVDACI